jgi:hypothetical protein
MRDVIHNITIPTIQAIRLFRYKCSHIVIVLDLFKINKTRAINDFSFTALCFVRPMNLAAVMRIGLCGLVSMFFG